jgi:hypothetical protein
MGVPDEIADDTPLSVRKRTALRLFLYVFRRGAGLSKDQGSHSGALMSRARAENGQQGRNQVQLQLLGNMPGSCDE